MNKNNITLKSMNVVALLPPLMAIIYLVFIRFDTSSGWGIFAFAFLTIFVTLPILFIDIIITIASRNQRHLAGKFIFAIIVSIVAAIVSFIVVTEVIYPS